jgi:hypothetical protein
LGRASAVPGQQARWVVPPHDGVAHSSRGLSRPPWLCSQNEQGQAQAAGTDARGGRRREHCPNHQRGRHQLPNLLSWNSVASACVWPPCDYVSLLFDDDA